ncbi:hypothetical protein CMV_013231 [Castanea mollissima]|uniref:Uncharacterized protein n=1 Tax=Castanea mollissima TaxID=60419 RepID=A0A8J4VIF9_9ROSI|nr:hypothetical protein CMV_013231 [Castanea mollissima]
MSIFLGLSTIPWPTKGWSNTTFIPWACRWSLGPIPLNINSCGLPIAPADNIISFNDFEFFIRSVYDEQGIKGGFKVRGAAWERGQIPESPNGSPNSLVNREDRDRSWDVTGSVRHGPFIISNSGSAQFQDPIQNMQGFHTTDNPVQSVSLDMRLEAIRNSETYDTDSNHSSSDSARTDPAILSIIQCDLDLSVKCGPSKKRIDLN